MVVRWVLVLFLTVLAVGCSEPREDDLLHLRVAVLPDQSPELLHRQHDLLVDYLSKELGIPVELILPRDYNELSALFHEGKADLAYFGGLTFVKARRADGAIPIAMRDIDLRFTSTFLTASSNTDRVIESFRGKRFGFGSPQSTSGHLMPRHFLLERNIEPEKFFSQVRYSGAHDKTAEWIRTGEIDLGVVNTYVLEALFDKGRLKREDFRVVWVPAPYPDYVWAVRPQLSEKFRQRLQRAFFALSPQDPAHIAILNNQSAGGFLPVKSDDFDRLDGIASKLGLLSKP